MLEKEAIGKRKEYYYKYDKLDSRYDWKHQGILTHIMSNAITSSKNSILRYMLGIFENSLIFILRYVDKLHDFKNYIKCNR